MYILYKYILFNIILQAHGLRTFLVVQWKDIRIKFVWHKISFYVSVYGRGMRQTTTFKFKLVAKDRYRYVAFTFSLTQKSNV